MEKEDLKKIALGVRRDIIKMIETAKSGHPGGSLSCADILTVLYFDTMKHNHAQPKWEERDRFILSKGHAVPALYAVLAKAGYLPMEELATLRKINSRLQGHPSNVDFQALEAATGSLGQGLGVAAGMALAGKIDKKEYSVYCLMGDGEQDEGSVWEALMFASHYKLDNLCAIIDRNTSQIDGKTESVMKLEPLTRKYESFGWKVIEIDGNNIGELLSAFSKFKKLQGKEQPILILANTLKGKGVSFMENNNDWHGKAPSPEEAQKALGELK